MLRKYEPPDVPGYFEQYVWPAYELHVEQIVRSPRYSVLDGTMNSGVA